MAQELVLSPDQPVSALIDGQPAQLALSTASLDWPTLSVAAVERLGLTPHRTALGLHVGGVEKLAARFAFARVADGGRSRRIPVAWFPDSLVQPGSWQAGADGAIGPWGLSRTPVRIDLGGTGGRRYSWENVGWFDSAGYAGLHFGSRRIFTAFAIERDHRLPLASAAAGALLRRKLGGRYGSERWREPMFAGLDWVVHELVLDRPLIVGPWQVRRLAVRIRDGEDGLSSSRDPYANVASSGDDHEVTVRGRGPRGHRPGYTLVIPSGMVRKCASLRYNRTTHWITLDCAPQPVAPVEDKGDAS